MADLRNEPLEASTAFTNIGVDNFGPFTVKIGQRNKKRWCCLFTCLTMRAVHIEVVAKLDTDIRLNSVIRFIAWRGKQNTFISNNKTNFVGAERGFAESSGMEQRRDQRTSNSTRNQMKVQSTGSISF